MDSYVRLHRPFQGMNALSCPGLHAPTGGRVVAMGAVP
jgi:hypothetical protein